MKALRRCTVTPSVYRALATQGPRLIVPTDAATTDDDLRAFAVRDGGASIAAHVGAADASFIRRRAAVSRFGDDVEHAHTEAWERHRGTQRNFRREAATVGVDAALTERLNPARVGFMKELSTRPVDKNILEEIFREQHGLRVERKLTAGHRYERWKAESDDNAPIRKACAGARAVFGFGGAVTLAGRGRRAEDFPVLSAPEIALVGAPNSGKSSVINALCNSFVAPWGHLSGTTTSVHFYSVAGRLTLVDTPGLGDYDPSIAAPATAEAARKATLAYLRCASGEHRTRNVRRVFVVVPSRPLRPQDTAVMGRLQADGIPFSVIMNKSDTEQVRALARTAGFNRDVALGYSMCKELLLLSARRLSGVSKLHNVVATFGLREAREDDVAAVVAAIDDIV